MGGGNLESLLMGDDSSSGESDNEQEVNNNKASASGSAVAGSVQPPQQQPQQPQQGPPKNQSELSQRLKSLYSPASHAKRQQPPQQLQQQQPPPPRPQQYQQGAPPSPQGMVRTSSGHRGVPDVMNHHRTPPPQQQQQHPGHSPQQVAHARGGIKHQVAAHQQPSQQYQPQSQQQQPQQQQPQQQQPQQQQPQQQYRQQYSRHPEQQPPQQQPPPHHYQQQRGSSGSHGMPPSRQPAPQQQQHHQQQQQQQQPQQRSVPNPVPHGGGTVHPGQRRSHDPFEPMPIDRFAGGSGGHRQPPSQQQQQQPQPMQGGRPATGGQGGGSSQYSQSATSATSVSTAPTSNVSTDKDREMRRQKERFLMFTRVLMKYLESKDPPLHQKVKAIIKDCAERNKRQERGYESVTASMKERLQQVVGESYWKRAESYLNHFLAQKNKSGGGPSGGAGASAGADASAGASGSTTAKEAQARQAAELKRKQEMERKQRLARQQKVQQQAQQQQQQQVQQPQEQQAAPAPAPAPLPATTKRSSSASGKGATAGQKRAASGKQASGKVTKKPRKAAGTGSGRGSKTATAAVASPAPPGPTGRQTPVAAAAPAATPRPSPPSPPLLREYNELMEAVDHAIHVDWTTAGLIMGSGKQKEQLEEEQKNLLYSGTHTSHLLHQDSLMTTPAPTSPTAWQSLTGEPSQIPFALRGWGQRNIVSPRVAWARVRRREQPQANRDKLKVVGEVEPLQKPSPTAWLNEEKAEEDPVLCLLSEATQIHIKQILQKALVCARQRQNLDGIRLWHQQCSAALATKGKEGKEADKEKPPLTIRLGCDISRQVARTMGNAALTCKRMEEALERKPKTEERVIPSERATEIGEATIAAAQSMGELSLVPELSKASETADYEAKRNFEIYGGKFSHDPPFGRVPKHAKLEVVDFQQGLQLNTMGARGNGRRFRARPNAFYF